MIKKLHFIFRREKQKGTNFFFNFTSDKYSLKVKKKKMIHTSFSSLGETKQEQWGPFYFPFLLLLEVPLVSKSYISCFNFLVFLFFLSILLQSKVALFFSRINLQIIVNVVDHSVLVYLKLMHGLLYPL